MGEMPGILMGDVVCKECPERGKKLGSCRREEWAEKVAEIEFFEVGNHAENGHLSPDKVTKSSDKWFVLKKTFTRFDPV